MKPEMPDRIWIRADKTWSTIMNSTPPPGRVEYVSESLVEQLRRERDRYKAALEKIAEFVVHRSSCGAWKNYTKINSGICTCGLSAALSPPKGGEDNV